MYIILSHSFYFCFNFWKFPSISTIWFSFQSILLVPIFPIPLCSLHFERDPSLPFNRFPLSLSLSLSFFYFSKLLFIQSFPDTTWLWNLSNLYKPFSGFSISFFYFYFYFYFFFLFTEFLLFFHTTLQYVFNNLHPLSTFDHFTIPRYFIILFITLLSFYRDIFYHTFPFTVLAFPPIYSFLSHFTHPSAIFLSFITLFTILELSSPSFILHIVQGVCFIWIQT